MRPAWRAVNSAVWSAKIELTSVSSAGPETYQGSFGAELALAGGIVGRNSAKLAIGSTVSDIITESRKNNRTEDKSFRIPPVKPLGLQ
jgi:hypothetical protein